MVTALPYMQNGNADPSAIYDPGAGYTGGVNNGLGANPLGSAGGGAPWQTSGLVTPGGTPPLGGAWPSSTVPGAPSGTSTMGVPSQNGVISSVQAPSTASALPSYVQAVTQSLAPTFQQQNSGLLEQLNAMGIVPSGAASNSLQQLYGQQGATIAGQVAPLISQGFQNQYNAGSQNASAANSYQQLIQNQAYGAATNNANNSLNAQEYNAGLQQQGNMANLSAQEQLQLAQLGYGNSDYQQMVAQLGGLTGLNLGAQNSLQATGMNNQLNAYTGSYNSMLPYYYGQGQSAGYGTGGTAGGLPGINGLPYTPQLGYNPQTGSIQGTPYSNGQDPSLSNPYAGTGVDPSLTGSGVAPPGYQLGSGLPDLGDITGGQ